MARSALRSVSDAIEATRAFLLPVSVPQIARLAVIAAFLGSPGTPVPTNPQFLDPSLYRAPESPSGEGGDGGMDVELPDGATVGVLDPGGWPLWLLGLAAAVAVLVAAYAVLGILLRFALVDGLRDGSVRLGASMRRHARRSVGLVVFRAVVAGCSFAVVAGATLAITPLGPWSLGGLAAGALAAVAVAALVVLWAVDLLTLQFVLPTMVRTETGVLDGWRRFWPALTREPGEYALFGVVRVLLGIAVGVAAALAVGIVLALLGVVVGTLVALVVVLSGGVGGMGAASWAAVGLLLALFLAVGIPVGAAVVAPFHVYLWSYALLVLGDTDEELDLIPTLREAARDGNGLGA